MLLQLENYFTLKSYNFVFLLKQQELSVNCLVQITTVDGETRTETSPSKESYTSNYTVLSIVTSNVRINRYEEQII